MEVVTVKKFISFVVASTLVLSLCVRVSALTEVSSALIAPGTEHLVDRDRRSTPAPEGMHSGGKEFPKLTKTEIIALLKENPSVTPDEIFIKEPSCVAPYEAGEVEQSVLQAATDRLNALRILAGLPTVTLDAALSANAQYGAVLLAAIDKLEHHPAQPIDMADDFYQQAYSATSSSNLLDATSHDIFDPSYGDVFAGYKLCESPDEFMDDSDLTNFQFVGHRRWQLNPTLGKIGFGCAVTPTGQKSYVVEKIKDKSGAGCDYDFISWPASGVFPTGDFFSGSSWSTSWSITLNPARYQTNNLDNITVTLERESDGRTWVFSLDNENADGYFFIRHDNYGINNCIIFHPTNPGKYEGVYTVTVEGLKTKFGDVVNDFSYSVDFFDPKFPNGVGGEMESENGKQTWELSSDNCLRISGKGSMPDYDNFSNRPPWYDQTLRIESVKIEEGITSIGEYAFTNCVRLSSVDIPDSVTHLESDCFHACSGLKEIKVPESVTYIGSSAFEDCTSLSSVKLPSGITNIDRYTFLGCANLLSITLPDNISSIGVGAFYSCKKLTDISIPVSVESVGYEAFEFCENLKNVYYGGTEKQWNQIDINRSDSKFEYGYHNNSYLLNANIHYLGVDESDIPGPTDTPEPTTTPTNTPVPTRSPGPTDEPPIGFTDIPAGRYYTDAVAWAVASGITKGTSATTFSPGNDCTRAQIVTFLWRSQDRPIASAKASFSDMPTTADFVKAINWAVEQKITYGKGRDSLGRATFQPNATCTRAEAVTFIWRAMGSPSALSTNKFTDMPSNADFVKAINWAVANGITKGKSNTTFDPNGVCNRGEIVTFLYRAIA